MFIKRPETYSKSDFPIPPGNYKIPDSLTILVDVRELTFTKMTISNKLIEKRKDILGGTPVFIGTRVPVSTFFEYLENNHSLNEFLEDFPTVTKEQAIQVLERFKDQLLQLQ